VSFQYTRELSDNHVWTWISTAFEGGSNYWIDHAEIPQGVKDRYKRSDSRSEDFAELQERGEFVYSHQLPFLENGAVNIVTYEGTIHPLNRDNIENGIMLMAMNSPRHFNDLVSETGDAITADVLLQYSLFGKVIYG